MKEKTVQRILRTSGVLALLGGGSCFLSFFSRDLGMVIASAVVGIGALILAAVLGIVAWVAKGYQGPDPGLKL